MCLEPPQRAESFWGTVRARLWPDRPSCAAPGLSATPSSPSSEVPEPMPMDLPDLYVRLGDLRIAAKALGVPELSSALGDLLYLHLCGSDDVAAAFLRHVTQPLREAERAQPGQVM
jgi:hypothetical protein